MSRNEINILSGLFLTIIRPCNIFLIKINCLFLYSATGADVVCANMPIQIHMEILFFVVEIENALKTEYII